MVTQDLHISTRLKKLLPSLTDEERKQLKANIEADGRVTDPILYWHDGKKNLVVDGMHRFDIARRGGLPYKTEPMEIAGAIEDVELWMLNRQLGRRNLLSPQAIRKLRGELYNRLKGAQGGDHTSEKANSQNDSLLGNAAEEVAEKAGVSPATAVRDGARVEALEKCAPSIQKGVESGQVKVSDADVKTLSKLNPIHQNNIAADLRKGQAKTVKEAMEKRKIKQPGQKKKTAKNYGKCPNCVGTKWTEDEDGVVCAKCGHPHGEPAGDADEDRVKTQRQKTTKTAEALQRAFDDLQHMKARTEYDKAIKACKGLLAIARGWK